MRMKTYQADTLEEAFRAIKAELGSDAVILQTRHLRGERTLRNPFGRTIVQVQAAVNLPRDPEPDARPPRPTASPRRHQRHHWVVQDDGPSLGDRAFAHELARSLRSPVADPRGEAEWDDAEVDTALEGGVPVSVQPEGRRPSGRLLAGPALLRAGLVERGCEPATASQLVADAVAAAAQAASLSEPSLREALHQVLTKRLRVKGARVGGGDRGKGLMVIGPTGAGKTLALAKLMTHYAARGMRDLALVKVERERRPGIDALQIMAGELGARIDVVRSPEELVGVVGRRTSSEIILVDTPGCSLLDREAVGDVRALCAAGLPLEVHLVLPAQTAVQDFDDMIVRYAGVAIHRLLFTKLDETLRYGRMLEIALRSGLPLSYVTDSREPHTGIDVATPDRMAGVMCGWTPSGDDDEPSCVAEDVREHRLAGRAPVGLVEGGVEWNKR